jgi:hypothetical protein
MQSTTSFTMQGGLDLVTPAIALKPGKAVSAVNYESDAAGYARIQGYERYDGRPSPYQGDAADTAGMDERRAVIEAVPGVGPVRGVWVYGGHVWAFRDTTGGAGAMYKDTPSGWEQQTFGSILFFNAGVTAFEIGETVSGGTSSATGTIERVITQSGLYDGTAAGYMVLSNVVGAFTDAENITSASGDADASTFVAIELTAGGQYEFVNHNFYGAANRNRMYFCNGGGAAYEWDGSTLVPIYTNISAGPLATFDLVLARNGDTVISRSDAIVIMRSEFDRPSYVAQYANHLFLAYPGGSAVFSGLGEPLDYRTTVGAGEIGVGDEITGLLGSASTSLVIFCRSKIDYLTGSDAATFTKQTISDSAGAFPRTVAMMDQPIYLDDGGLRNMSTTQAFGDWKVGTLTEMIEPLMRKKRRGGVVVNAAIRVREKGQYRLFWEDGTGLFVYFGRKNPEVMPVKFPIKVECACSGELDATEGRERLFIGADSGFVYEADAGCSFDGDPIPAYVQLAWNTVGAPLQTKRFHKATVEIDAPDDTTVGVLFQVDYDRPGNVKSGEEEYFVDSGTRSDPEIGYHHEINWLTPVMGVLDYWMNGVGRNMALSIISETAVEEPHTLTAATVNYTPRRVLR